MSNRFLKHSKVEIPIIGGAMYPCSNPELVAAVSEAGGLGVIQPITLQLVHGLSLPEGIQKIRALTQKPLALNVLTEKSAKIYQKRMEKAVEEALEHGIRFFVTYLGKPDWVVKKVKPHGGIVYHDLTTREVAKKVADQGVDGLICVNRAAGGHAGDASLEALYDQLKDLGLPCVAAGGISTPAQYRHALKIGYEAIQMGTRFIATQECQALSEYKQAIVNAKAKDITLTWRVTGVPLAVIKTPYVEAVGTEAGWLARKLLKGRKTKHWVRLFYSIRSLFKLRNSSIRKASSADYWQAGQSVEGIDQIESVSEVFHRFTEKA